MDRRLLWIVVVVAALILAAVVIIILFVNSQVIAPEKESPPVVTFNNTTGETPILENTPYCGDGVCNSITFEEDCFTCPQDCGECPGPKCDDGLPQYAYELINPVLGGSVSDWLASTSESTLESIQAFNMSLLTDSDLTVRRGSLAVFSIETILFSDLRQLYNDTELCPMDDVCNYINECPMPNLYSATELIISQVGAMVASQNQSYCIYDTDLDSCLYGKIAEAEEILIDISTEDFDYKKLPTKCAQAPFLDAGEENISGVWGGRYEDLVNRNFNLAISNARKKNWALLQSDYESVTQWDTEPRKVLKIMVAEEIIQFNKYYQYLKSIGCA